VRQQPQWLTDLRAEASACAHSLGVPSRKNEAWRYTSAAQFLLTEDISAVGPVDGEATEMAPQILEISPAKPLPTGVFFGSFEQALNDPKTAAVLEAHLGTVSAWREESLDAWNLARFQGGTLLYVPAGIECSLPLEVRHGVDGGSPQWNRVLIVLEDNARAHLAEIHEEAHGSIPQRSLDITEIVLGQGAKLVYGRLGFQASDAIAWSATIVRQGAASQLEAFAFELGAGYARNEIRVLLEAPGAEASLRSALRADASRHLDMQTVFDHKAPDCRSQQVIKGVFDGESTGIFHGRVYVQPGAHGTKAQQSNRNLLLSRKAQVYSRPQLEIENDDVQASHGSATGNLDEKALFFLRSRGFSPSHARDLLVRAFLREITDALPWASLRGRANEFFGGEE